MVDAGDLDDVVDVVQHVVNGARLDRVLLAPFEHRLAVVGVVGMLLAELTADGEHAEHLLG